MTTLLNIDNLQPSTATTIESVKISNIQVTNSSYVVQDDTAVSLSGGYIKITGSNFNVGVQVYIGQTLATSVTRVSSTEINCQIASASAGSYIVYVVNTNGSTGIRVNGVTYSGSPTWVTSSTLPGELINIPISIQLSATGDTPLVYTLQTGSTLPPGLSLTSAGLLSGTVTGITSTTVYNFTIEVTDPELQESPRAFTITITGSDQYFSYVNLLISANTPSSTFVTDASTNSSNVTVVGDTRPNNFGPYTPGYYSNYFDGAGDYLSVPDNAAFLIQGDFTFEAWVYQLSSKDVTIIAQWPNAATTSFIFRISSAGKLGFAYNVGGEANGPSSTSGITYNTWNHVVWTRSGTTFKYFINGVQDATTATLSGSFANSAGAVLIGLYNTTVDTYFNGYISNARFVKGTAVYAANFTPSTTPLTAIANTSLLTCQSNRFIDNSTNNFAITRYGDTLISPFIPFVPASNTATYGSGYFDGSGDYLTTTMPNLGTGSFTTEFWLYPTDPTRAYLILDKGFRDSNFSLYSDYLNLGIFYLNIGGTGYNISFTPPIVNQWNHIAISRDTASLRFFLNGVQLGTTQTNSGNVTTGTLYIGGASATGSGYLTTIGYISNLRITTTAVYTANFTPPTIPLTAISGTSLLTLQFNQPTNNNMFVDNSTNNFLVIRNGNATQGTFSPYPGTWSNYFDGTGDYLTCTISATNNIGTSDYTIEAWVYPTTSAWSGYQDVITISTGQMFGFYNGTLIGYGLASGGTSDATSSYTGLLNTWQHIAITRQGSSLRIFANGTQVYSGTPATSITLNGSTPTYIGTWTGSSEYFPGYISNLRIVRGTALYTSAFTIPTQPLTAVSGTILLTCADNRFIDDSNNNFTITRNGDVSVQKFSPFTLQTQIVPTTYSVYFDGTGDYLTVPANTAFAFGTGDFTIEAWVYQLARNATYGAQIAGPHLYGTSADWLFIINTTGNLYFQIGSTTTGAQTSTSTVPLNAWTHVVVVRSGGNVTFYINGVAAGTGSYATSITNASTALGIGAASNGNAGSTLTGYISNLRIVKGTAVYTGAFTPPTSPLTAIANTSLLTCQSTTIIDNSTNNFIITVNGNSQPLSQNPFGYTNPAAASYTASALGGSMYFDGTGDYLTIPNYSINWSTFGSYTIEFWAYHTALSASNQTYISTGSTGYTNFYNYGSSGASPGAVAVGIQGTNEIKTANNVLVVNAWNHIAYTYNGTTTKIYVNGVQSASATTAVYSNNSAVLQIATGLTTQPVFGYMSDVRIVRGQVLYNSNFVPPAAPLTAVQNSVLLLNSTSAGVTDNSMIANYETIGGAIVTTSLEYYGSNSVFFNGTNSGLFSASSVQHSFGSGNFTIEFWYYPTSTAGTNPNIMCNNSGSGAFVSGQWSLHAPHSSYPNKYSLWVASFNTGAALLISTSNIATNAWTFVTITRTTNTWRLFINGTIEATATHGGVLDNGGSNPQYIGYQPNVESGRYITGYMCDVRFTKGYSRYTTNFSVPTSPFLRF